MITPSQPAYPTIDAAWVQSHLERNLNRVLNPTVCYQVLDALKDPNADFSKIAGMLGGDPFIAAKTVGLANLQRRAGDPTVTNIHRAVAVLGTRHVQTLVLAVMLTGPFVSADGGAPRRRDLWRWVFGCAAAGDFLGKQFAATDGEDAGAFRPHLVGGLLLGLGALILQAGLPREYDELLGRTLRPLKLADRERRALGGVSHHDVTLWALEGMRCPSDLGGEARLLRVPDDGTDSLRARAVEVLGARAAGFETAHADEWLEDVMPRLGVKIQPFISEVLPTLRKRVRELTKVYDADTDDRAIQAETRQRATLLAGQRMEELLHDEVQAQSTPALLSHDGAAHGIVESDSVTGLLTRRAWQAQLRELNLSAHPTLGLLLLEIDGFVRFADRVGRRESERALGVVATILRSTSREPILLGRYGSHEFVGLYELGGGDGLQDLAAQVRELLAAPEAHVAGTALSACIGGVAVAGNQAPIDWQRQLSRASEALLRARHQGKGSLHVEPAAG